MMVADLEKAWNTMCEKREHQVTTCEHRFVRNDDWTWKNLFINRWLYYDYCPRCNDVARTYWEAKRAETPNE